MRTIVALWTAWGLQLALGLALAGIYSTTPPAAAAPLRQDPSPSHCVADGQQWAFPRVLLLGETTTVTMALRAVCPPPPERLHVVLVLDASGAMAGDRSRQMKDAARKLVERLNLRNYPGTEVGVVEFNGSARTLCTLTDISGQANGCIARVGVGGSSCIDCGIREGIGVFLHGRRNSQAAGLLNEVMVVFSDGGNKLGCDPVLAAARQAKFNGILVVTVCVGPDCAAQCLSQVASSARYFFTVENAGGLIALFERIRQNLVPIFRIKATVLHTLPADMAYVPGSAVPAAEVSPAGDQLKWTTDAMMLDGITLTLRLRPRLAGRHPVSVETTAEITDAADRKLTVTFPIAWITVLQPFAPTATPGGQPTPSDSATPTSANPPTSTPAPKRWVAYLPVAAYLAPRANLP